MNLRVSGGSWLSSQHPPCYLSWVWDGEKGASDLTPQARREEAGSAGGMGSGGSFLEESPGASRVLVSDLMRQA